jgi:DNA invertase Pin-like site-specific DNA recombinase
MKPLLKAVPYLRVSEGDLSRQKSLGDQLDEARQFASDEGVEIAEGMSYVDDGISGRSVAARPALKQLLEDAQSGRLKAAGVSVVLCWGVDRLGRNQREALNVVHALNQCGIELMTVRERCNTGDPGESKLTFAMEAMIAESYSETLGALARRGHQDAAHKGRFCSPTAPYGYRRVKGGIEPDPKEAELVREVFRLFLDGRSRHGIAKRLKETKVAKRGGSLDWCIDEITRILTSDAVIGVKLYKGVVWDGQRNVHNEKDKSRWIVTPNAHAAIIDLDTFVKAQRLIRDRKSNINFNTMKKHFSLLGGLDILTCGKCGSGYNSMIGPGFRMRDGMKVKVLNKYYACGRRSRHRDCQARNVQQAVLDHVVLQRIAAYVRDTDALRRNWKRFHEAGLEKLLPLKGKLQALDAEIAQLDQKQARFIDALGTGDMPKTLFSKHSEDVARRLRAVKADRRAIKDRVAAFDKGFDESKYLAQLAEFNGQFETLPPESRKMLLKQLVTKITINGPYEFVIETTFLPEPVSFPFGPDYEPPAGGEPGERR